MASMVSKLARAAFSTRASPSAVKGIAGAGRPIATISVSPADAIHISRAEGPNSEKEYRNPPVDDSVLESKESMWAFYEYWCKFHGISRDRREMTRRFKMFSNNARMVHKVNNSGSKARLAMNHLADLTNAEYNVRLGKRRGKR